MRLGVGVYLSKSGDIILGRSQFFYPLHLFSFRKAISDLGKPFEYFICHYTLSFHRIIALSFIPPSIDNPPMLTTMFLQQAAAFSTLPLFLSPPHFPPKHHHRLLPLPPKIPAWPAWHLNWCSILRIWPLDNTDATFMKANSNPAHRKMIKHQLRASADHRSATKA